MKKLFIKTLNKLGLYTYDQVLNEVDIACNLISDSLECESNNLLSLEPYERADCFFDKYVESK